MTGALFIVGGCAYRNMVHTRHMSSVLELLQVSRRSASAPVFAGLSYMHTSNLPRGRCEWLRALLATEAEWAVTVDSDTEFSAPELLARMEFVHSGRAIGIAPVVIGGTGRAPILNINDGQGRVSTDDMACLGALESLGVVPIQSGGFGLAVFNLRWFRRHWPAPVPERVSWERSEDIAMCESVTRRGGSVVALAVGTVHHELTAMPGQQISYLDGKMQIA